MDENKMDENKKPTASDAEDLSEILLLEKLRSLTSYIVDNEDYRKKAAASIVAEINKRVRALIEKKGLVK